MSLGVRQKYKINTPFLTFPHKRGKGLSKTHPLTTPPMKKNLSSILISLTLLLSLSACGPMYSTNLAFQQPKSSSGKQCVNTCLQNRSTCQMQCNAQNEQCRNN